MVHGHSKSPENMECAGENGQMELCWSHVGTWLKTVCNLSFLLLGGNILVHLRASSGKQ